MRSNLSAVLHDRRPTDLAAGNQSAGISGETATVETL
jgi:hypothetical protein